MGNQLLSSKIIVEEEQPALRGIPAVDTAVAGFIGVAEKGPVTGAHLVNSMSEFSRIFGGWTADSAELCAAVQGFFENGGSQLYVHRSTVFGSGVSTAATAAYTLVNGSAANTLRVNGKYPGTYAHIYYAVVTAASSGEATEFNLEIRDRANLIVESWPNLTMDATAARYAPTIVNNANSGSTRISVTDMGVVGSTATRRPANAGAITTTDLVGGTNALPTTDAHWYGTEADANGLYAFDTIDDLTILAIPGVATPGVQGAMITYAEVFRGGQVFCVLDPPTGLTATGIVDHLWNASTGLQRQTEYAAMYWPNIRISNPSKSVFGTAVNVVMPPSGHIAGVFARTDNARTGGIWDPPAGTEAGRLNGVVGFETDEVLKEAARDRVFPRRVNPLTTMSGFSRFIDGARTLKADGNWPTVAQRRGVSMVERSIKLGLQFARHKNNNEALRQQMYRTVYAFLKLQTDLGAFASTNPDEAFFVDFSEGLNPATTPNILTGRIGLATVQPAEFIRLLFSQDTRAIEAALAA